MAKEELPVIYSNFVQIAHAGIEFLIDFKQLGPETRSPGEAPTVVRVVLHPTVAKSFRDALAANVRKYEEKFGEIPIPAQASLQHERSVH